MSRISDNTEKANIKSELQGNNQSVIETNYEDDTDNIGNLDIPIQVNGKAVSATVPTQSTHYQLTHCHRDKTVSQKGKTIRPVQTETMSDQYYKVLHYQILSGMLLSGNIKYPSVRYFQIISGTLILGTISHYQVLSGTIRYYQLLYYQVLSDILLSRTIRYYTIRC